MNNSICFSFSAVGPLLQAVVDSLKNKKTLLTTVGDLFRKLCRTNFFLSAKKFDISRIASPLQSEKEAVSMIDCLSINAEFSLALLLLSIYTSPQND
jgi:hypothetical protein